MAAPSFSNLEQIKTARIWREFDTYVRRQSYRFELAADVILTAEGRRAGEAYAQSGEAAALDAVEMRQWQRYVSRLWLSTVPQAGAIISDWLQKAPMAFFIEAAANYLKANGAARAAQISRSSQEGIANQIRIGIKKGETRPQIARRISDHYRSIKRSRARTIARTEVHAAANYGSISAAEAENQPMEKIWIATPDGRARDAHIAAGGQRRRLDQAFNVGGERLQYPGDSTLGASAAMVINCRCFLRYQRLERGPRAPYRIRPRTARRRAA